MTKIAVVGDLHVSLGTSTRDTPYLATFEKLRWIASYCLHNDVSGIILTGDIFDNLNKYIPNTIINSLADILCLFKWVWFIPGNHDFHKVLNLSWQDEPVGSLVDRVPNMKLLTEERLDAFTFVGCSWKKDYDRKIGESLSCPEHLDPSTTVIVAHAYLLPKSENIMGQFLEVSDIKRPASFYITGHYHKPVKPCLELGSWLLNPGSLTRIKSSETHTPLMYVLDTTDPAFIQNAVCVDVPCLLSEDVFKDLSAKKNIQKLNSGIADFVKAFDRQCKVLSREDFMSSFSEIARTESPEKAFDIIKYANHLLDLNNNN
jgi:DNA repair exonuclease SbcCD nuclease subunit